MVIRNYKNSFFALLLTALASIAALSLFESKTSALMLLIFGIVLITLDFIFEITEISDNDLIVNRFWRMRWSEIAEVSRVRILLLQYISVVSVDGRRYAIPYSEILYTVIKDRSERAKD